MQRAIAPESRECIRVIQDLFEKGLSDSVASLLGENVQVSSSTTEAPAAERLWFRSELRSPADCHIEFGAPKQPWLKLGRRILGVSEDNEADNDTVLSTLKEISAQVAGFLISSLNAKYRKQIEVTDTRVSEAINPEESGRHTSCVLLSINGGSGIPVKLVIPKALVEFLTPEKLPEPIPSTSKVDSKKLELLLDVEMPVSVSIGRTQMALKDVIKLTTGSIVELGRNISEPVDIVVNNCIVARGDVVVVDGNFGVRIREVLSKEDRIQRFGNKGHIPG
jgi:flagellar motor switch protein FliN/FliY